MDKDTINSILSRSIAWVSAADSKIAPILAIDTAMLGVLLALVSKNQISISCSLIIPIIAVVLLLLSIFNLINCTFPRLSGPKNSVIFFGGIAEYTIEEYKSKINKISNDELIADISEQTHRNAEIANEKFQKIKWAMIFLYAAIPFWLIALWLLHS